MKRQLGTTALIAALLVLVAWVVSARDAHPGSSVEPALPELVVSSARDAGPDTLRDAILAADRLPVRARIVIQVPRIVPAARLPALVNPHGIELAAGPTGVTLDAVGQSDGAVLQIEGAGSVVRGLRIVHAHAAAVVLNAPGAVLERLVVEDSSLGVLVQASAHGAVLHALQFINDDTGVLLDASARHVSIIDSRFQASSRAGIWFVGAGGHPAGTSSGADVRGAQVLSGSDATAAADGLQIVDSLFEADQAGVVLANAPTLIRRSRFINSHDSAVLVLGGPVRVVDSEVRHSGGNAISVNAGSRAVLSGNQLLDNSGTAILARDSEVLVEHNTLSHNGVGIVAMGGTGSAASSINDNLINGSGADAITLIGGVAQLHGNRLIGNHGAAIRALDLMAGGIRRRAELHLDGNVLQSNTLNEVVPGIYHLRGPPP